MSTSTVYNYLSTMEQLEYLVNEDGKYRIGMEFYELGIHAKQNIDMLETIEPVLEMIANETGEAVWFIIEEHGKVVHVDKKDGEQAVPTATSHGERQAIHCMAAGKAILAHYPRNRVQEIIDTHGLEARTESTITDLEELFEELERIRDNGVAFNKEESASNLHAVAAPLFHRDEVFGAIAIPGPANRLSGSYFHEELREVLLNATNELELKFRYS